MNQLQEAQIQEMRAVAVRRRVVGGRLLLNNDVVLDPAAAAAAAGVPNANNVADGKERVLHVRPLTDRVIISTTSGRVLAINLDDGKLIWQTRLATGRQVVQTLASDDFTAARLIEGQNVQVVVLDTYNGQQIWRKNFVTGQQNWPMNMVLSPDGMLIWTTPSKITGQDLYEPGDLPRLDVATKRSYMGMLQPDQLIVNGLEVLAVSNGGQFVDRRSIRTGHEAGNPLSTNSKPGGAADTSIRLRMSGPRLYIVGAKSLMTYHLEQDTATEAGLNPDVMWIPDDVMITRDYLILPGKVTGPGNENTWCIQAYSRLLVRGMDDGKLAESGSRVYKRDFVEQSKIESWAAVDGGIYYLTGDDRLVFLKGTRQ
jgi:hypothetical protein